MTDDDVSSRETRVGVHRPARRGLGPSFVGRPRASRPRGRRACVMEREGIRRLDTVRASFSTWFYLYLTFFFFSMCVHDTYTGASKL